MTADPARRAAVLGSPIGHSLSPLLHRAAYEHLGLVGWTYEAYDVAEAGLAGFLAGLDPSWVGLSLTMPLKAAVLPLLDAASPMVETVGAANTVLLRDGRRVGENTDVPGMAAALAAHGVGPVDRAVVLGGGATARSAVAALSTLTDSVQAYVRDPARHQGLQSVAAATGVDLQVEPWARAGDGAGRAAGGQHDTGRRDRRAGREGAAHRGDAVRGALRPVADPARGRLAGTPGTGGRRPGPAGAPGRAAGAADDGYEAGPDDLVRVLRAAGERALRG